MPWAYLQRMLKKLTPVLIVDAIEPLLPLWKSLGFQVTVEVPHGDALGFANLARDGIEIMYQTRASVREDAKTDVPFGLAALFIEVDDLDAMAQLLPSGTEIVVDKRKTFYGSTETIFRDGAGNVITFAQFGT